MKNTLFLLKVGALMAVIFASGIYVGRVTAPVREVETVVEVPARKGSGQGVMSPETKYVFRQYVRQLKLDAPQQIALSGLFIDTGERVKDMPRLSRERLAEFEKMHAAMELHLNDEQKKLANEILEAGRKRILGN